MRSQKTGVLLFAAFFAVLAAANLAKPADAYSAAERRALSRRPALTWEAVSSGRYMRQLEAGATDQFPMREPLRRLKAGFSCGILRQRDNHGYYRAKGHLSRLEYPLQRRKWDSSFETIGRICDEYLADTGCRVYFAMIPDKNCYLAPVAGYPSLDYDGLAAESERRLPSAVKIDLRDTLELDSYYRTDPHWRQEKLPPAARRLASAMGAEIPEEFRVRRTDVTFSGAYPGQAAMRAAPDALCCLTDSAIDGCRVVRLGTGAPESVPVYDMEKARGRDPYEMFLGGAAALLTIENPAAATDRALVIFRDSFGSAIAPLLIPGYRRITLVDLRYLRGDPGQYLRFDGQDVLFLYSTTLLNRGLHAS